MGHVCACACVYVRDNVLQENQSIANMTIKFQKCAQMKPQTHTYNVCVGVMVCLFSPARILANSLSCVWNIFFMCMEFYFFLCGIWV